MQHPPGDDAAPPRIGPATAVDVPGVLRLRRAAFAAHAPAAYSPREVATLLDDVDPAELYALTAAGQLFVARAGGALVGVAGWQGDRVRHVYVDPARTRQGIATALLRRAETEFHARTGGSVIRAGVALHAEAFYRANGYELLRRATAWDGSAYLEMSRRL